MTASIVDRSRVTGTIACSGADTANPITTAVIRTALGFGSSEPCEIGSINGRYTHFSFRVDTTGGRTWDFAVDDIGDGTYTTLKTGLASGANVNIGILPGAFSDGTEVGCRRPFSFLVTLSSADASSVISFSAIDVKPSDALRVAADLTATNTAIAAVSTQIGGSGYGTIGQAVDYAIDTALPAVKETIVIASGSLDGAFVHTTTVVQSSTLSGTVDYYGTGCRLLISNSADGFRSAVRTISSYSTANKQLTLSAALPWTPVNGDTYYVVTA